ncbi:S8 family serine peptidase [Fodinicola feengrottensis]|uniref:S8 family serine peptidase n=1 Tax=Fodinicola feengrottensis TaxID=435914 RepID=UPI0013D50C20|nr:S8 family serine peptidase [Fodinicola feengrottensis]
MLVTVVLLFAAPLAPAAAYPIRDHQWYLAPLQIPQAQQQARGQGVIVAVIDSGVDDTIPELAGRVLAGSGFGPGAGTDGRKDLGSTGHGTAMASLIAGAGADDQVLGVAPASTILPISVLADQGAPASAIAAAIRYATDRGAKVINLSLGAPGAASSDMRDAIDYALARDVVVVAAAGNVASGDVQVANLASVPGVVAVSGIDKDGSPWSGSAKGPQTVVSAPSTSILVATPARNDPHYALGSGTSQATALTSGTIALLRSRYPGLNAANIIERLIATAQDRGAPGRDTSYGFGEIQPYAALTARVPGVYSNPLLTGGSTAGADPEASPTLQPVPIQPAPLQPTLPGLAPTGPDDPGKQPQAGSAQDDSGHLLLLAAAVGVAIGIGITLISTFATMVFRRTERARARREAYQWPPPPI